MPVPQQVMATVGLFSVKEGRLYFSLAFQDLGWLAADLVQYLDDILESKRREAAILRLLGMTLQITPAKPERRGEHWVIVDLEERQIETNSEMLRLAINQKPPPPESPYSQLAMQRIHRVLDRYDFTVEIYK